MRRPTLRAGQRFTWRQGETLDELIAKEEAKGAATRRRRTARVKRRRNLPLVNVFADDGDEDEDDEKPCLICEL
jgi:hypothetical protein